MRKYNQVFKFLAVFVFIGFFWIISIFLTFSFPKHKDTLKDLLPDDMEIVVSVNTDLLIKTLLFDALYKTEFSDSELKLLKEGTQSQKAKSFGVEINSEIVMFYNKWNNTLIQGFLFNISNNKDFNQLRLKGKNDIKKSNGSQGVILIINDEASDEMIAYATQFADNVVSEKSTEKSPKDKAELLCLKYKGNQDSYIQDLTLNIEIKDEKITLKGQGKKNNELSFSAENYNMFSKAPTAIFLEIQSGHLPDSLYEYFDFIFNEIGIKVPKVTSQQMYIYGMSIENISGSTTFLPKFDWILRFDSIVDIDSQLDSMNAANERVHIIDQKTIQIGGSKYFYKQISAHEIYIGVTEFPAIESTKTQILPLMRGFPSAILEIEGKGLIAQFINVIPLVKNTKVFMKNVEYFDIHTVDEDTDSLKIDGEIRLNKGKMMSVELAKFILMFAN